MRDETRLFLRVSWRGLRLCVCRKRPDGTWYWDYCPDCGKRGGHESCGIRCG